jgi:hypothetical protein
MKTVIFLGCEVQQNLEEADTLAGNETENKAADAGF